MPNTHIPRIRQERERRGWSRNYVAEQVKVDVVTVGRWERGERLPHPIYRQKLCELFEMNAENLGLFSGPSQERDKEAINPDFSTPPKDIFINDSEPQADVDAADALDAMNEGTGSSQLTLAPQEETTKGKSGRNTWYSSRLAHLPKRRPRVILAVVLLAVVAAFGVLSFTLSTHTVSSTHAVSSLQLIYTNGTSLSKDCTYGNKGLIAAPYVVANDCRVRVWLYQNVHQTGRTLCISPGRTTTILHIHWTYFWVSKNSHAC